MSEIEHVYACPDGTNKGAYIIHPKTRDRDHDNGIAWCWSHHSWEPVPESWLDREAVLRDLVREEWASIRKNNTRAFKSPLLTERMSAYCAWRGWREPDPADRWDVFRFINSLEWEKPIP